MYPGKGNIARDTLYGMLTKTEPRAELKIYISLILPGNGSSIVLSKKYIQLRRAKHWESLLTYI